MPFINRDKHVKCTKKKFYFNNFAFQMSSCCTYITPNIMKMVWTFFLNSFFKITHTNTDTSPESCNHNHKYRVLKHVYNHNQTEWNSYDRININIKIVAEQLWTMRVNEPLYIGRRISKPRYFTIQSKK